MPVTQVVINHATTNSSGFFVAPLALTFGEAKKTTFNIGLEFWFLCTLKDGTNIGIRLLEKAASVRW